MRDPRLSRRTLLQGTALGLGTAALGLRTARAALPSPSSPVTISVVDVAGNLALTQKAIENFRKAKPQLVSKFNFTKAPGTRAARQDQGAAGGGPRRHRPRADRHRRARGRHRAGPVGRAAAGPRRRAAEAGLHLSAARRPDADPGQGSGRGRHLLPLGPAARVRARARQAGARQHRRAAGLGEGQPQPLHVRPPGQLRPGPHLHHGPALHPGRQGPEGPDGRLGEDLGLPRGAGPRDRVLPVGHRRDDEGAGRGLARHHRVDHRLGHQPARARRRAGSRPRSRRSRASTGSATPTTWSCPRACRTRSSACCSS